MELFLVDIGISPSLYKMHMGAWKLEKAASILNKVASWIVAIECFLVTLGCVIFSPSTRICVNVTCLCPLMYWWPVWSVLLILSLVLAPLEHFSKNPPLFLCNYILFMPSATHSVIGQFFCKIQPHPWLKNTFFSPNAWKSVWMSGRE